MVFEHHKKNLSPKGQKLYDQLFRAFAVTQMQVSCKGYLQNDIIKAYTAVMDDHPELFHLSHAPMLTQRAGIFNAETTISFQNVFSQNEIFQFRNDIAKLLKQIESTVSSFTNEEEVVKYVCDYLIPKVTYEINNTYNQNAATVLIRNKGQCSGISRAVKLILDYLDIECMVVEGLFSSGNIQGPHAWNIVCVNGQYHHLDVTNMMGANMSKSKPYNYLYFNYGDDEIGVTHKWNRGEYPKCVPSRTRPSTYGYGTPSPSSSSSPGYKTPYGASTPTRGYGTKPVSTPAGYGRTPTTPQQPRYNGLRISTLQQYRIEIGKLYDAKKTKLEFESSIPINDTQVLLNTLLDEAIDEAKQRNIGLSVNVSILGAMVEIEITWR